MVCLRLCLCLCLCLCLWVGGWVGLSVCEQVFSRAVSAVGTERGGMDKHHGRSVRQETGSFLAASYSTGVH